MTYQEYQQSPEIQAYLDLNSQLQNNVTGMVEEEGGNPVFFTGINFLLTTILTHEYIPASIRLSTMQSYLAYYAIAWMGDFVSEMLERSGNSELAGYFGSDYDELGIPEIDFGDKWYDNVAESMINATLDTAAGMHTTLQWLKALPEHKGSLLAYPGVLDAFTGKKQPISYDSKEYKGTALFGLIDTYTYTYKGTDGSNYFNMEELKQDGYLLEPYGTADDVIVNAGKGDDYIAHATIAYGEGGSDIIQHSDYAYGGYQDDYLSNIKVEAHGGPGQDYITNSEGKAYGGTGKDLITNIDGEAYGNHHDDILINNEFSYGGDGNDYIVGSNNNYDLIFSERNVLDGGAGDDYLEGKNTGENLFGGIGADILIGGGGNDNIDGGEDGVSNDNDVAPDVAIFRNDNNFTFSALSGDWEYQVTGQGTDKFKNIESVVVQGGKSDNILDATALAIPVTIDSYGGNDTIKGGSNHDILVGGAGDDHLFGNGGNDVLMGQSGFDTFTGGAGADLFYLEREPFITAQSTSYTPNSGGWSDFDKYPRQVADVNGDGRADIVGFGSHTVYVSLGEENGTFRDYITAKTTFTVNAGWDNFQKNPRQLADVNGDGRADIVAFGDNQVVVALGQENGTFGNNITAYSDFTVNSGGWSDFNKYPRQVADVNGDGRADIVAFGDNQVIVALGRSNGTFGFGSGNIAARSNFTVGQGWDNFEKNPRHVADVNGDGRADIVAFGDNTVIVSLGQTNGTFSGYIQAKNKFTVNGGGWSGFDKYPRQVTDVNGDGRADIVGFGNKDVIVALGQENGTFGDNIFLGSSFGYADGWTSFNQYPRHVADVTGDGLGDVIAFGANDVYVEDDLLSGGITTDHIIDFNGENGDNGDQGDKLVISKELFGINSLSDLSYDFITGELTKSGLENPLAIIDAGLVHPDRNNYNINFDIATDVILA